MQSVDFWVLCTDDGWDCSCPVCYVPTSAAMCSFWSNYTSREYIWVTCADLMAWICMSILNPDNGVSVCLSVCQSWMWEVLWYKVCTTMWVRVLILSGGWLHGFNLGHYQWWVASWLQPWSLSQQCDATKRHALKNCPVALVKQGIFP